jgi:hypothetical protein
MREAIRSGWKYSSWSSFSPERLRHRDRLLARHRVEDEQHVRRLRLVADGDELVHQLLVDVQAAGGVDDDDVERVLARPLDASARGHDRIGRVLAVDRHLDLAAELLELVDRRRALEVGGDEPGLPLLLAQEERELGRGGRLSRALEAGEQDHRRRAPAEGELRAAGAHQLGQLLVDDLHDLLAGREALRDVGAERALAHPRDEVLHDLEVDVRLEQREADLPHRARDRLLVEASAAA